MADVLVRRVARFADVQVVRATFEDFRPAERFGLLLSGEAWHWTVPETRWSLAAAALEGGATLALFWNNERIAEPALRTAMLQVFARHAPARLSSATCRPSREARVAGRCCRRPPVAPCGPRGACSLVRPVGARHRRRPRH